MGTTVEIALGAAICIVCIFLICVMVKMRKKPREDHITELKMTDVHSRSVHSRSMHSMTQSQTSDVSIVSPVSPPSMIANDYKYQRIIEILKVSDPEDWESYLVKFRREKLTDDKLMLISCDPENDSEPIWREVIPQI